MSSFRLAFEHRRVGFADRIVFLEPAIASIRKQKEADATRRRGHFELHLSLGPLLREWYGMIESLAPGRVLWQAELSASVEVTGARDDRFCISLFEALVSMATRRAIDHPGRATSSGQVSGEGGR